MNQKALKELLNHIGFKNKTELKKYMIKNAKWNEWGSYCHQEERKGIFLDYDIKFKKSEQFMISMEGGYFFYI